MDGNPVPIRDPADEGRTGPNLLVPVITTSAVIVSLGAVFGAAIWFFFLR